LAEQPAYLLLILKQLLKEFEMIVKRGLELFNLYPKLPLIMLVRITN